MQDIDELKPVSFRFSADTRDLITKLVNHFEQQRKTQRLPGSKITRLHVLELALHDLAERELSKS